MTPIERLLATARAEIGYLEKASNANLDSKTGRLEVAELAREVYNAHFPYAERNTRKKQLLINMLVFELHDTTVYDEFSDKCPVNIRFTANRLTNILTMTDFDADGIEQTIILEKKQMGKLGSVTESG